jgi:hypothetical protein
MAGNSRAKTKISDDPKKIKGDALWKSHLFIHRLTNYEDKSLSDKRVVLNPTNPSDYADENQYHIMYSENSHVVGNSEQIEFHFFVDDCGWSDSELKLLLTDPSASVLDEKWFIAVHVVNLHHIVQIKA